MDINPIRSKIKEDEYELTLHAIRRRVERKISTRDIENVILNGKIIQEYSDDKPFPSCLITGKTEGGKPLYVVCAIAPVVKIITVYVHKEDKWVDHKQRKER